MHVSMSNEEILKLAEEIGIKKADNDQVVRTFVAREVKEFPESGLVGPLTLSDVHRYCT